MVQSQDLHHIRQRLHEETELASFLVDVAKAGYGKTRGEIKWIAENVASGKIVLKHRKISEGRKSDRQFHLLLRP